LRNKITKLQKRKEEPQKKFDDTKELHKATLKGIDNKKTSRDLFIKKIEKQEDELKAIKQEKDTFNKLKKQQIELESDKELYEENNENSLKKKNEINKIKNENIKFRNEIAETIEQSRIINN